MVRRQASVLAGSAGTCDQERAGDSRAEPLFDIARVYADYCYEVQRYLRRTGADSAEAEDITHEVFLTALNPSSGARKPKHPFAWLITCAKRLAIRRSLRGRREVTAPSDGWEGRLCDPKPSAESALDESKRRDRARRALCHLSAVERQCLLMRSHGHTFREIAAALDIKLHQAAYHTDVAIEKMQRRLGVGL